MYISLHNHTALGSNLRGFMDSINRVENLVDKAHSTGSNGIAITDHDCLTASYDLIAYVSKQRKKDPESWKNFKPICGNEIYLLDKSELNTGDCSNFYHFILLAKDKEGWNQITRLSSKAWVDNFFTHVIPRTPTFYDDLFAELDSNQGHLIGSTACLGSCLDKMILSGVDPTKWALAMQEHFGKGNFFLEMQPGASQEQIAVNKAILSLSKKTQIPYIITTDSHYLDKDDKGLHKAFLLSDDKSSGNREIDSFYESAYYMTEQEIKDNMSYFTEDDIQIGLNNTQVILGMCEEYSLDKQVVVPYKPVSFEEINEEYFKKLIKRIPTMQWFRDSEYIEDRHLIRDILDNVMANPDEYCNDQTYAEIENNLNAIKAISENTKVRWSAYLLMVASVIDTCWKYSLVGTGRGSCGGFILCKILGITQVNPLKEPVRTFAARFLSAEKVSTPDIDVDVMGEKREEIVADLRKQYGGPYHTTKVQTISTAKARKAIQIACRGLGYTPEEGVYLGSFITSDRGIMRTISQTLYGDAEKEMEPNTEFYNLMTAQYPDVLKMALKIENLPCGVGSHAGGVILSINPITDFCGLMRTRAGDVITAFDLHKAEACGLIKLDLLATDAQTKMKITMDLLLRDGYMKWQGTLRDTYNKYLDPYVIDRTSLKLWEMINNHKVLSLFQFESSVGYNCIEKCKPSNLAEMVTLNSLMRLAAPIGETENPLDRYCRMSDISQWYTEMEEAGLSKNEMKMLEKYLKDNHACATNQEEMMLVVAEPLVGGHPYVYADRLRKACAKKDMKLFAEVEKEFFDTMKEKHLSENLCNYVWRRIVLPQKLYSFCCSHVLFYSLIALQEANLAYNYPIVYWNCANLISDSGGEDSTVNYDKIATAVSRLRKEGIDITPPDINRADFDFKPYADVNNIVFGLKPVRGVGAAEAKIIVAHRPYKSLEDFCNKIEEEKNLAKLSGEDFKFGDTTIIQLIKAGSFDALENKPREEIMRDFIMKISKPLTSLGIAHVELLKQLGKITPLQVEKYVKPIRFRNYIANYCKMSRSTGKGKGTGFYILDDKARTFFDANMIHLMVEDKDYFYTQNGIEVKWGSIERELKKLLEDFKKDVLTNPDMIRAVNDYRCENLWREKCPGTISRWEMDSMCYYYHEHELAGVDFNEYNIEDFFQLPEEPQVVDVYNIHGQSTPRFKLSKICGTVVSKDNNHETISLLTPTGVVTVKFYKGQYNFYSNATNSPSWFGRGTKLLVTGIRNGENFVAKKYKDSIYPHTVVKIDNVREDGKLDLTMEK